MKARFGPFVVDVETRQLVRDGTPVHLSTKAFDLLCVLVEQRPRVVDKTELQSRLWPDTYVVDNNLNVLIGEIRRAIADDARQPRYVRTVHGVGYAFCGEASVLAPAASTARSMPCWLTTKDRTFRLAEGDNIVGRDPESHVWLDSPSVSRRHARIVVDTAARQIAIDDLESKNGTFVRGEPVHGRRALTDGDEIAFGSVDVKLYSWNGAAGSETKRIPRKRR